MTSLRQRRDCDLLSFVLTRDAVREVDRAATEDYAIPGIVLMENAARGLAEHALDMLDTLSDARCQTSGIRHQASGTSASCSVPHASSCLIVCGGGNNGGDGYALARHLTNAGANVTLMVLSEPRPNTDAAVNRDICRHMTIREVAAGEREMLDDEHPDLIVDAIFGTGLDREITGTPRDVIHWINDQRVRVLAVDVPSGLDCDSGEVHGVCIRASMTVTFVALKPAFQQIDVQKLLGEVRVADIGAPRELVERLGERLPDLPPG